jgi:hypothetical protein
VHNVAISLCGLAMLGVIVDRAPKRNLTQDDLYQAVPPHARRDELPGQLEAWPHDALEWLGELQALLDRQLVARVAGENAFVYLPTSKGDLMLRGALHPAGADLERCAS